MRTKDELQKRVNELLDQKQQLDVDSKEARALQTDIDDILKVLNDYEANDLKREELRLKQVQEEHASLRAAREAELKKEEMKTARIGHYLGFGGKIVTAAASIGSVVLICCYEQTGIFPAVAKNLVQRLPD